MDTPEEQIRAIVLAGFQQAGAAITDVIKYEINEAYPPASEPSTPPHLRTGNLQAGIHFVVDDFHDGPTLTIISEAFYSQFLALGTKKMAARDFFGDAAVERYMPVIVQALQEYINSRSPLSGAFNFVESRLNSVV